MHLAPLSILACIIAVALAQSPNPPKIPSTGYTITAGQSSTFQWTPTTQGTVTLTLRNGAASDLNKGTVIASGIPNSGSYTFTLPADTTRNSDYTIEIASDSDPSKVNYTPQFVVESSNTVDSTSSPAASQTASASAASSSAASAASSATSSAASGSASKSPRAASAASSAASSKSGSASATSSGSSAPTSTGGSSSTSSGSAIAPSSGASAVRAFSVQGGLLAMLLGAMAMW